MKRHSTSASISRTTRFLREGGAFACLATLMLAALAQPALADRIIPGVTAQLHVADVQVREGERAVFILELSRPLDFDIRYAYRTQDLTARAGKDYVAENAFFVIPAGTRAMPLDIRTLKDNVIDNDSFQLVLSDYKTYGYGKVWGQYRWTDWWSVEGLPLTLTATARIKNVPGDNLKWRSIPNE